MNKCGSCTECCYVMSVDALDKPNFKKCDHQCVGCNIYEARPASCDNFNCTWLLSGWDKSLRPDKINMVLFSTVNGLEAYESKHNSHKKHKAQVLMNKLTSKNKLKVTFHPGALL